MNQPIATGGSTDPSGQPSAHFVAELTTPILLSLLALASYFLGQQCERHLFLGLLGLCLAAGSLYLLNFLAAWTNRHSGLPRVMRIGYQAVYYTLMMAAAVALGVLAHRLLGSLPPAPDEAHGTHYTAATVLLVLSLVFRLIQSYLGLVLENPGQVVPWQQAGLRAGQLIVRLFFMITGFAAILMYVFIYSGFDLLPWLGVFAMVLALLLVIEKILLVLLEFYRPKRHRQILPAATQSLLLNLFFAPEATPGERFRAFLEEGLRIRMADLWFLRELRRLIVPFALCLVLATWLATALTTIPMGSQGVLTTMGRFSGEPLGPGLHLTAPWPFQKIQQVETEKVRSLNLGFDRDKGVPILWNEPHFEGEENLLVGSGENFLTINVPIYYSIVDPVAFLTRSREVEPLIKALAYRQLLRLTVDREIFAIMTTERAELAQQLQDALQTEVDELGLGLQIVLVGLKDIHPPVEVAPAYQDVVSAEEEKEAYVHLGESYRTQQIPAAQTTAFATRTAADADIEARLKTVTGEAQRFRALATVYGNPDFGPLLSTRLRMEALQEALRMPNKIIIDRPGPEAAETPFFLDLREALNLKYAVAKPENENGSLLGAEASATENSPRLQEITRSTYSSDQRSFLNP